MNKPERIILHCSATPDKGDLIGASQIRYWHVEERGWSDIGYHFVIRRSGLRELGREEHVQGAHTRGENKNTLGICLVGTRDFTAEQIYSLKILAKELHIKYGLDESKWNCHYEYANKDCPNIPVEVVRELVKEAITKK